MTEYILKIDSNKSNYSNISYILNTNPTIR